MELFDEHTLLVRCRGVDRRFVTPGGSVLALDAVALEARAGDLIAVAGPSGSGKSTLLAVIGAVDRADAGSVDVAGRELTTLSRRARRTLRRTIVSTLLPLPSDNLFERLDTREHLAWATRRAARDIEPIDESERLGIGHLMARRMRELSGGEQQRVAIAMALAQGHRVLLADEPTASLDSEHAQGVIDALRTAAGTGTAVIVATHDRAVIDAADRVVWLENGRVVEAET